MKRLLIVLACLVSCGALGDSYQRTVIPFLKKNCIECHGGKKVKGKIDFTKIRNLDDAREHYKIFESSLELIHEKEMPPEDEPQPSKNEIKVYESWYKKTFIDEVKARPAEFKPRRLSVTEYKNTVENLFGFKLEVAYAAAEETVQETSLVRKVLPTDPPGKSGFKNDTSGNPLSPVIWDGYSYIIDTALGKFFSKKHRKELEYYSGKIDNDKFSQANAESLIRTFYPRALRRSVPSEDINKSIEMVKSSKNKIKALKTELKAILMSPRFIYRGLMVAKQKGQQKVDQFEYAERLSYFLWASMPDSDLFKLAEQGKLTDPKILKSEISRMISDQRSRNLSEDLADQWFALSEIENIGGRYPFIKSVRTQPVEFFNYLVTENRPLMELIDSKVTFANPLLRGYYKDANQINKYSKQKGIEVEFVPHNKIILKNTERRGGIMTMPGILAMNASKGRTSPVLRGTWVLERILGDHLPEPPMDVGQVAKNKKGENLSFRERFEAHRSNKTCAVCHDKIDPLGFALEAYDSLGKDRLLGGTSKKKKKGKSAPTSEPIDTTGNLYGDSFKDFQELKNLLKTKHKETIVRNIVRRFMSYGLSRKLEYFDRPEVERIVQKMIQTNGTYKDLVFEIATSLPFKETIFQ